MGSWWWKIWWCWLFFWRKGFSHSNKSFRCWSFSQSTIDKEIPKIYRHFLPMASCWQWRFVQIRFRFVIHLKNQYCLFELWPKLELNWEEEWLDPCSCCFMNKYLAMVFKFPSSLVQYKKVDYVVTWWKHEYHKLKIFYWSQLIPFTTAMCFKGKENLWVTFFNVCLIYESALLTLVP